MVGRRLVQGSSLTQHVFDAFPGIPQYFPNLKVRETLPQVVETGDGEQVVAVALEGHLGGGSANARMVVIPNGPFAVNGEGQQQQSVNEDNINLASNAIDWISDDTGLINLRTKGVTNRPLEQLEDSTKTLYKYGNVIVPILFVLILGFFRKQRYNAKKQKWIQGNI